MYKALIKKEQRLTQINMKDVKKGFRVRKPDSFYRTLESF